MTKKKVKANKKYPIDQCRLYKATSRKKICEILSISHRELKALTDANKSNSFYSCYKNSKGRLIQEPINLMYRVHNQIANLLSRIETPSYMHYSKKGCSHITNASAHLSAKQLITFDIKAYYQNISENTIRKFFRQKLRCEPDIAYILAKICSFEGSLPTGSQISVYLCNLVNLDMFNEMYLQTVKFNQNFTVYADDITISGKNVDRSHYNVMKKIMNRYGYAIKDSKTKRYTANQTPIVTGIALIGGNGIDANNAIYKKLRESSESLIFNIDNQTYMQNKDECSTLEGRIQYLKQLKKSIPQAALRAQLLSKKKLGI